MVTIQQAKREALAKGCRVFDSFQGEIVKSYGLEVGDVFTFPTEYQVFADCFGEFRNDFIFIINQYDEVKKFYPSVFTHRAKDGYKLYKSDGTATDMFMSNDSIANGMDALRGRTVHVTNIRVIYNLHKPVRLYTIDFV